MKDYIDFQVHDKLNPKLWDNETLKSDVRRKLIKIANAFHKFLNVKAKLRDVIMTGSSSNYNYSSKFSDIDLHLLYDFDDVLSEEEEEPIETEADLVKEYMMAKKTIWNDKFDITINGVEVELYSQDIDEPHEANGQFSIVKNNWVKKPEKIDVELDEKAAESKAKELMDLIDHTLKGDPSDSTIQKLKDKIKRLRQIGLDKEDGEYSVENLAFKVLRRSGYIEKLWDSEVESQQKDFSL